MSDFRQIYFKTKTGNGVFLKVRTHLKREDISIEDSFLCTNQTDDIKYKLPLSYSGLNFIDFAYFLSEENCNKIFGSDNEYIWFLSKNKIKTFENPKDGRWILLFHYS